MKQEEKIMEIEDFVIADNRLYYSSSRYNGLFYKDLNTEEIHFVGLFPNEDIETQRLHARMVYVCGSIVFVPFNARNIVIYDVGTGIMEAIPVDQDDIVVKYWGHVVYGDSIYIFPLFGERVLCLNIKTKQVDIVEDYADIINERRKQGECVFCDACLYNDKIYATVYKTGILTQYNLLTKELKLLELPDGDMQYSNIASDEKGLYITAFNKREILYWEPEKQIKKEISYEGYLLRQNYKLGVDVTLGVYNNMLCMYPFLSQEGVKISFINNEEYIVQGLESSLDVGVMLMKDNYLCLFQNRGDIIIQRTDLDNGKVEQIFIDKEIASRKRLECLMQNDSVYESEELTVQKFLDILKV